AGMTEPDSIGGMEDPIWFREGPNGKKKCPIQLALISKWYERNQLLPSVELSADEGKRWSSIVSLRHSNEPAFPFRSFYDNQSSGMGSIEIAREIVSNITSENDRLESQMETIWQHLKDEERVFRKRSIGESDGDDCGAVGRGEESDKEVEADGEETSEVFYPRFFCNQAFRLVAREESTALHEMNRVCA
ncbi:hypothetical protein PENTCL1PPCAC_8030, partial [Pristionchus entomophagus]